MRQTALLSASPASRSFSSYSTQQLKGPCPLDYIVRHCPQIRTDFGTCSGRTVDNNERDFVTISPFRQRVRGRVTHKSAPRYVTKLFSTLYTSSPGGRHPPGDVYPRESCIAPDFIGGRPSTSKLFCCRYLYNQIQPPRISQSVTTCERLSSNRPACTSPHSVAFVNPQPRWRLGTKTVGSPERSGTPSAPRAVSCREPRRAHATSPSLSMRHQRCISTIVNMPRSCEHGPSPQEQPEAAPPLVATHGDVPPPPPPLLLLLLLLHLLLSSLGSLLKHANS